MKIFAYLWQLPQTIATFIVWLIFRNRIVETSKHRGKTIFFIADNTFSAVSFGEFIFCNINRKKSETPDHEYGHSVQSLILGPLYLILVGIPSVFWNIRDTLYANSVRKKMEKDPNGFDYNAYWHFVNKTIAHYYTRYPEKWADVLGNVKR